MAARPSVETTYTQLVAARRRDLAAPMPDWNARTEAMHESVKKAYEEFAAEKRAAATLADPAGWTAAKRANAEDPQGPAAWAASQAAGFGQRFGDAAVGGAVKSLTDHLVSRPINSAYDALRKRLVTAPRQRAVYDQVRADPMIAEAYASNPQAVDEAYGVAKQYAPSLTMNPAVLRSLLRQTTMSGGTVDLATVRMLADIERTLSSGKGG